MIRVFPSRNKWTPVDDLTFFDTPGLFRPPEQPVRVSVTFTWDRERGEKLAAAWAPYYSDVQVGGPAYDDPGGEFVPGRFIRDGVVMTSRGCPKRCDFCFVSGREGSVRELKIHDGWIVNDNNLLACSKPHVEAVFRMLRKQKNPIQFQGGLDATLLRDWHRDLLDNIRIGELWFACDSIKGIRWLQRAAKILDGIPPRKRRCYVLIGYDDEDIYSAEKRLERVYELGFWPFAMLYRPPVPKEWTSQWRKLQKHWCRPAAYRSKHFKALRAS